ncbi:MAG: hypothetical protein U0Y68_16765 [Blastocatellia bacterium]
MSQRKPLDVFALLVIALGTASGLYAAFFLDWTPELWLWADCLHHDYL